MYRLLTSFSILALFHPVFCASVPRRSYQYLPYHQHNEQNKCKWSNFLEEPFPDPSLLRTIHGVWYSFATESNGKNINVAKSSDFVNWQRLENDALPDSEMVKATWAGNTGDSNKWLTWAPDVWQRSDGKFVMYYSAIDAQSPKQHCIGAATSANIESAFTPESKEIICARDQGGAIDASYFQDGPKKYMIYKIDANSIHKPPTLYAQEMACNGPQEGLVPEPSTQPIKLLDSEPQDGSQGIEAPYMIKRDNTYYLFFSTNFYADATYNTEYATASSIQGPWTRAAVPLLQSVNTTTTTADCQSLNGPGGASFAQGHLVFHNRHLVNGVPVSESEPRGLMTARYQADDGVVQLV